MEKCYIPGKVSRCDVKCKHLLKLCSYGTQIIQVTEIPPISKRDLATR